MTTKKRDDLNTWLEEEYRKDTGMEARVNALVAEMAIEQDLVALREAAGISQRALAKRLGVSQPAIAKLESGKVKNVGVLTLTRYAAALGGRLHIDIMPGPRKSKSKVLPRRVSAGTRKASGRQRAMPERTKGPALGRG